MERLLVFADFDWLDKPELVGELCYEKLRGSESYAFRFDDNWLKFHAGINFLRTSTTIPACNTLCLGMIFSAVFQMRCPTGGGAPCSKEENKYRHQKKRGL